MNINNHISYVEFPACNIEATKQFFSTVFGWSFKDFGPDYAYFPDQGIGGGFYRSELASTSQNGAALVILYTKTLEKVQAKIEVAGGSVTKPIFDFPGGRRFHFKEPSGNELAVWSDVSA